MKGKYTYMEPIKISIKYELCFLMIFDQSALVNKEHVATYNIFPRDIWAPVLQNDLNV